MKQGVEAQGRSHRGSPLADSPHLISDSGYASALESKSSGNDFIEDAHEPSLNIPAHLLNVRPAGNSYAASSNAKDEAGLFGAMPDEILVLLLEYLDSYILSCLGSTCTYLYAFCHFDDLWKALFIDSAQSRLGSFQWRGSWRSTYLDLESDSEARVNCDRVFSDVLYRPFLCTYTPLAPYATSIPEENKIPHLGDLGTSEFQKKWSDRPFVLTDVVKRWQVYRSWDVESLIEKFGNAKFRAEAVDWTLKTYSDYMRNNQDESPLYLFDRSFCEKMDLCISKQQKNHSYWIPQCFGEDLFTVLGDQRPDNQWLIIGPARSGSTYHKDPNQTSAWNAVIRGSKYWIMFPPSTSPPGVYMSEDQSEVTSPLSIAEWLLGFHEEARKTPGCMEAVCKEGEVLHVPAGWWHLVVNLEESIAITQNFVPRSHLRGVLSFLRDRSDQVSGFKKEVADPYGLFVEGMKREHPELLQQALDDLEKISAGRKRKWEETVGKGEDTGGFSFGFGADSDEEIPRVCRS